MNYSKIVFLIKSDTINLDKYTIKDIPGSSGRLDVISRCILSALLNEDGFDNNFEIWVFFKRYDSLKFMPERLNYSEFPKNELLLSDSIARLLKDENSSELKQEQNPLSSAVRGTDSMLKVLKEIKRENKNNIWVLKETGKAFSDEFSSYKPEKELFFIIGNQSEDFIISEPFLELKIPELSLGPTQSYLASQVVRLIKLNIKYFL